METRGVKKMVGVSPKRGDYLGGSVVGTLVEHTVWLGDWFTHTWVTHCIKVSGEVWCGENLMSE